MTLSLIKGSWFGYIYNTFVDNIAVKFIASIFGIFISEIYLQNEMLVKLIIFLFIMDFITGVIKAIKNRVFRLSIFAKGTIKLMIYGMFMMIALAVDKSVGITIILPILFVFLTTTDAGSILENIEELGYDIPKPLVQLFKIHKQKFFYDKIKEITGQELLFDYQKDFKTMKRVYIPMIKEDAFRKMFEFKIQILEGLVNRITKIPSTDCKTLKIQLSLLLETVGSELEDRLRKEHFKEKDIDTFLDRYYLRVDQVIKEINNILSEKLSGEHSQVQRKNNIIQAIVRIIYNGIGDNVIGTTRYKLKSK